MLWVVKCSLQIDIDGCSSDEPDAWLRHIAEVNIMAVVKQVVGLGKHLIALLIPCQAGVDDGKWPVVVHLTAERGILSHSVLPAKVYAKGEVLTYFGLSFRHELMTQIL